MSEPTKTLQEKLEYIGGCGDGGCIVHVRPGMHTNGGCRCNREPQKMSAVIYWHKKAVAEHAAQIEALRSLLTRWSDYQDVGRIMGGVEAYERLAAETDAALQPKEGEE